MRKIEPIFAVITTQKKKNNDDLIWQPDYVVHNYKFGEIVEIIGKGYATNGVSKQILYPTDFQILK